MQDIPLLIIYQRKTMLCCERGILVNKKPKCYEEYISAICLILMFVLMAASVIGRFSQLFAVSFCEEVVTQTFLVMSMLAISACVVDRTHMGLSILTDMLKGKTKVVSLIFTFVIEMTMFVFLLYLGVNMVLSQNKYHLVTSVLGWPKWIFTLSIPAGAVLYMIRSIQMLIYDIKEVHGK